MQAVTAESIRKWMQMVLDAKGWSPRQWALRANVAATTVTRALNPNYQFVTSTTTLGKLAAAAGFEPPTTEAVKQLQGDVFEGLEPEDQAELARYAAYLRQRRAS